MAEYKPKDSRSLDFERLPFFISFYPEEGVLMYDNDIFLLLLDDDLFWAEEDDD